MSGRESHWTTEHGDEWVRTLKGRVLRVRPDPDDPKEPWVWEVLTVHSEWDDSDEELGFGTAESREAAMAAAEMLALSVEGSA